MFIGVQTHIHVCTYKKKWVIDCGGYNNIRGDEKLNCWSVKKKILIQCLNFKHRSVKSHFEWVELWSNMVFTFPLVSMSLIGHLTLLLMYKKARLWTMKKKVYIIYINRQLNKRESRMCSFAPILMGSMNHSYHSVLFCHCFFKIRWVEVLFILQQ